MIQTAYNLNVGQQAVLDYLVPFCLGHGDVRKVLLKGHAGTGKTFVINRVVESTRAEDGSMNFGMTAPTHKAVRVLKKHSDLRDQLDFGTIHSFLGLKQKLNAITGEITYEPEFSRDGGRKIDDIAVLIVDESSMLDDKLHGFIEGELSTNGGLRVIYMGDEKQIPPVGKKQKTGEANAIPFIKERQNEHGIHVLELTEPQRQAKGSQIIAYATAIREQHLHQKVIFPFPDSTEELQVLPTDIVTLRKIFREYFCTTNFQEDADYVKVIAWRNATVDFFNTVIRLLINNAESLPKIIDRECLIMDAPLVDGDKILLTNNEEVITSNVREGEIDLKYTMYALNPMDAQRMQQATGSDFVRKILKVKCYKCTLTTMTGKAHEVKIIHEDSAKEFEELKKALANAAKKCLDHYNKKDLWKQMFRISEHFAWVKYNYCITAHKSQGSSYDYCISMEWDIEQNRDIEERNRIRYVAATRARNKLFIVREDVIPKIEKPIERSAADIEADNASIQTHEG